MTVFDSDTASDDTVGSMAFELHKILRESKRTNQFPLFWKYIYGAAPGVSGK